VLAPEERKSSVVHGIIGPPTGVLEPPPVAPCGPAGSRACPPATAMPDLWGYPTAGIGMLAYPPRDCVAKTQGLTRGQPFANI
jgi:hypothetical protein